jgi:archaellum component FlaC|tara:strand:- start:573 stop:815 length:243 start_codon:yes stop_codon:yes gene_type:complete
MGIDLNYLQDERKKLQSDFDTISSNIEKTKKSLTTQQNNLNAVYGAIQQIDKLIPMVDTEKKDTRVLLNEKDKAVSASLV